MQQLKWNVVQLTLKQHDFELWRSIYMQIFSINASYSITPSAVTWIYRLETFDTECEL